jgi:type III secretory pathway lipoprotein EscJ
MRKFSIVIALIFASACGRETVAHQQDARAAIRIVTLLSQEGGIDADQIVREKSNPPSFDIAVAASDRQAALKILERHNLPIEKRPDTCSLLMDEELIPTADRDRAKRVCGVSGDIANKLRSIEGVVEASALVSIPDRELEIDLTEERLKPNASIIISYLPTSTGEPPISPKEIARFASAALPGLSSESVFVRMVETKRGGVPDPKTCIKTELAGILLCSEHKSRLAGVLLAAICASGFFAAVMLFAVLRAMRYRRDLTKLTAAAARAS